MYVPDFCCNCGGNCTDWDKIRSHHGGVGNAENSVFLQGLQAAPALAHPLRRTTSLSVPSRNRAKNSRSSWLMFR